MAITAQLKKLPDVKKIQKDCEQALEYAVKDALRSAPGKVADAIREAQADVVFVCLGAPKQEKWMARWGQHSGAKLAIGLGGVLDVYAGNVERAPESWQKLGLEWAYRLKKEPQRIGRMSKLPLVLVKAAGDRVKGRKTKE